MLICVRTLDGLQREIQMCTDSQQVIVCCDYGEGVPRQHQLQVVTTSIRVPILTWCLHHLHTKALLTLQMFAAGSTSPDMLFAHFVMPATEGTNSNLARPHRTSRTHVWWMLRLARCPRFALWPMLCRGSIK